MQTDRRMLGSDQKLAARHHERRAGAVFDLSPDLMRTQRQRRELLALADRLPRDARLAMRRTAVVRRIIAVDANCSDATQRKLIQHRRTHRAKPDYGNIGRSDLHRAITVRGPARVVDSAGSRSHRDARLHAHGVVVRMQPGLVLVQQTSIRQCLDVFMHAAIIAAKRDRQGADAARRVPMQVAQQLEPARKSMIRANSSKVSKPTCRSAFPAVSSSRSARCQASITRFDMPSRPSPMWICSFSPHVVCPLARSTSATKSCIRRSIDTKTYGNSSLPYCR